MPDLADEETVVRSISELVATCPAFASSSIGVCQPPNHWCASAFNSFKNNNSRELLKAFRSAVALAPDNALFWTNYGTALDRIGSFVDAAACLEYSRGCLTANLVRGFCWAW